MNLVDYISSLEKPTYAPSFNGTYLEDVIPGYRTTDVTGRESWQSEVKELSSEIRDWALFTRNRRQPRDITVKFTITTSSNERYRSSTDKLKGILTNYGSDPIEQSEFQIIFRDESDKYYKGVITNLSVEKLVNYACGSGEFTIHCADPCKYSLKEYEVYLENDKFNVDYDGTYYSHPIFEVRTMPQHVANPIRWVSFINQDGKIIQIGNVDEVEVPEDEIKTKSEVIFDNDFTRGNIADEQTGGVVSGNEQSSAWATPPTGQTYSYVLNNGWTNNGLNDIIPLVQGADAYSATGKATTEGGIMHVKEADYGYGAVNPAFAGWHGPIVTRTSKFVDSQGSSSHKNGTLEIQHKFVTGSNDYGEFMVTLNHNRVVNGETKRYVIARLGIFKKSKGSNKSYCNLTIYSKDAQGGRLAESFSFDSSSNGQTTKASRVNNDGPATHKITKIEDQIIFDINGTPFSFKDIELKDLTIDSISFAFAKHGSQVPVTVNYLYSMKFTSHSVKDIKNVPDKLKPNGRLVVDSSTAEIRMNGILSYDLGALGNDWETFYLKPGQNEIEFTYSSPFATGTSQMLPVVMKYRKVYL